MDQILYEEILAHYMIKLQQSNENLEEIESNLKADVAFLADGWSGKSFDKFETTMREITDELDKSNVEIEQTKDLISAIREEYLIAVGI